MQNYHEVIPYKGGYAMRLNCTPQPVLAQRGNGAVEVFSTIAKAWRTQGVELLADGRWSHWRAMFTWVEGKRTRNPAPVASYATPEEAYLAFRAAE